MIKNVIFDMGGVLVDLMGARCVEAFEAIGSPETAWYVREIRNEDLFKDIEDGTISTAEFCNEVRRISERCSACDEEIVGAWNVLLEKPSDEKKERLLRLRAEGYRVFLLSNTNDMHWQYAKNELFPMEGKGVEDFFERVFLSYELHLQKPDPEIFRRALNEAGIKAEETIFIDDNAANVSAAESVGIRGFHEREGHRWIELLETTLRNG